MPSLLSVGNQEGIEKALPRGNAGGRVFSFRGRADPNGQVRVLWTAAVWGSGGRLEMGLGDCC